MKKKIPVQYTSREFGSIKEELVRHAKRYYPEQFQDFNEAGFGSLMLDTVAYVGDMLSFYLDYQANESFLDTANEFNNVVKLSKQLGYKFDNSVSSTGIASFYVLVPADESGIGPDSRYLPVLKKNSTFTAMNGTEFILGEDVRFDSSNVEVAIGRVDEDSGLPTYFAIKSYGTVISGKYVTVTVDVGDYKKFNKIEIPIENLVEIISVRDTEGFEYYEVENLMQDVVYKSIINRTSTNDRVDSFLRPYYVPRRFVLEKTFDSAFLQFGSGLSDSESTKEEISDPSAVALKFTAKNYISNTYFDPSRLIESEKMGIVPSNTTLSVTARVNSSEDISISSNTLTSVGNVSLEFEEPASLDRNILSFIRRSVEVNNEEPIIGKETIIDTQDIKKRAQSFFSTQNRAVTRDDYRAILYRMPGKFGAIKRANVIRDEDSYKRNLNIYLLSADHNGKLIKTGQSLKENVRIWLQQNKMINDTIDIIDGKIVNLSIRFSIINDSRFVKENVLISCLNNLRTKMTHIPEMGEPFSISDVYRVLRDTDGVLDVVNVVIENKVGGSYSNTNLDIERQKSPDNRYIDMPQNAVWEIKFPNEDIRGTVV